MQTSNKELRRSIFGETSPQPTARFPAPAVKKPIAPRSQSRSSMFANWVGSDDSLRPDKKALAERLMARAAGQLRTDPAGRQIYADAGKGLAAMLMILASILAAATPMSYEFDWLSGIGSFLKPFATPALMVFAGMFMRQSRENAWPNYLSRKIFPLLLALTLWAAAALMLAILSGGDTSPASLQGILALGATQTGLVTALVVLPLFMFVWKFLGRYRTGTIFVFAAMMEILHTEYGGPVWTDIMRGFVYFAAGHCFAPHFRALARFVRGNAMPSAAIFAVWVAFNALLTSADLPLAFGEKISTLPFASLALGLSGAAAMVIAGELIAATRFASTFALMGRNWIAFYTTIPLTFVAIGHLLTMAGLFALPGQAMAALLLALMAAIAIMIFVEMREPFTPQATTPLHNH